MASPIITIATVTYNCLSYTRLFLESLQRSLEIPYHLIIVDNHSTDGTVEYLLQQPQVRLIQNQKNNGFGEANNQAFKITCTPYFLGFNNDTVIFPGFIEHLLSFAEKRPSFAEFGVNSNCIGAKNPWTGIPVADELQRLEDLPPAKRVERYYGQAREFSERFRVKNPGVEVVETPPNFIGGWCFLVRTEAIYPNEKLFDPRFTIGFWEDVDLSFRLAEKGYLIGFIREVYLHHFNHQTFAYYKNTMNDRLISKKNARRFANKWNKTLRQILLTKLEAEYSLREIAETYYIFKALFGKKTNYELLEKRLVKEYFPQDRLLGDFLGLKE